MKIQSLSLLFAAVLVLSACGGAGNDASSPGGAASSAPATLPSDIPPATSSSSNTSSAVTTSAASSSSGGVIVVSSSSAMSSSSSSTTVATSSSSSSSSKTNSSVSSSATSSSSVASAGCSKIEGNIFIDCTDPAWKDIRAVEQTKDYKTQGTVTDGTQGQIATWHTLVSADQGHNNVIEVQFKDNDNYNALVHFVANTPSETRDMSAYATGKLMFDIKLLKAGKLSPQLNVMLECIYPCISHDHHITIPALDQWTSVEVPIAEFIEGGFDVTKTGIGFEILPEWNKQNGVQFQVDNIRWVKGAGIAPTPEPHCYEERFETWGLAYRFDTLIGSANLTTAALTKIISTSEMTPNWSATTDKFAYAAKTNNSFTPCVFTDGNISAQVYLPKSYVDDGKMRVGLYYEDSSARRAYFPSVSASSLSADAWKTISTPLVAINNAPAFSTTDASFDMNNVNYVGVYFDANGKPASVGGMLRVDNIFISGKPVVPNVPSVNSNLCGAGTQSFNGTTPTGIGFAASQHFYVRAALNNATFVDFNQSLSSANTQSMLVQGGGNGGVIAVFDVTTLNGVSSIEKLQAAFNYQATNTNSATSVTFSVYSTLTEAVNASNNKLSTNTIGLVSGVTCSSSSRTSSSVSTSSSSKSSSSSSIKSSSSLSSVVSSTSSSSSSRSSSSSSSKSSCSVGAKVDTSSLTLGVGMSASTHRYLVIKISNAEYVAPSPQASLTTAFLNVVSSNSSRLVYDINSTDSLPSSSVISLSFGFQQLDPTSTVTRNVASYDTLTAAMNDANALTSSSAIIANANSCGL